VRQALAQKPFTERLFRAAGITSGARVLDVGSGAGDVAMLAAELVGESGSVVGIDCDEAQVDFAATRCSEAGFTNVGFVVADLNDPPGGPFDAVVGRLVLQYQGDPDAAVRALASRLVPGGVMAFVEQVAPLGEGSIGEFVWPEHQLGRSIRSWVHDGFVARDVIPRMGLRLRSAFRAAGLEPQDPAEASSVVFTGDEAADVYAGWVRTMLPVIVEGGMVTAEQIDIDTLADRLIQAAGDKEFILLVPTVVAAWARKPAEHSA
jgi:ubiquinone/menaquinone biosynthesis C-methylase UbiE